MITELQNPFDPTRDHRILDHWAGETIGEVLEREGLDPERYVIACNGELLPPERGLSMAPRLDDDVHLVIELRNAALKTIAMIGVMAASAYFTAGLGNFIGGVLFPSLTTAAQNAIAATVLSVGGSLLVQGVASLFETKPGGNNYGVLGPQMTARSGIPIPKGYGYMLRSCNAVESWIDIQGDNGDAHDLDDGADKIGRQYINARFDFGWGPLRNGYNLQLNGKDIGTYTDVAYVVIDGVGPQTPVTENDPRWVILNKTTTGTTTNTQPTTDFTNTWNNFPYNQRVTAGVANNFVICYGQSDDCDQTTVFVTFPQGVWRYDDNMVIKRLTMDYEVWVRASGSGDAGWTLVQHHQYENIRQTLLRQATFINHPVRGRYDTKVVFNGSGAPDNPIDQFQHESNKFGDELWVESVQEMTRTTLLYPRMIQVVMRIMASGQISGADLQLTMECEHGLTMPLPAPLTGLPEDCHAAVAYDMHCEPVYGLGQDDSNTDLYFLADWAALTQKLVDDGQGGTQRLATFNGVFDRDGENGMAVLSSIGLAGYANLQRIGKRLTGWLDADDVPVQAFHMGNISLDSYSKTYLDLEDRAQQVEITAAFASDQYKTANPLRVVRVQDQSNADRKKVSINLRGCTDKVEAWYWANRRLQEGELTIRTHNWDSTIKAIRSRSGNVVKLQHDVPGYGKGGNLKAGSTAAALVADQPLTMVPGAVATVVYPALQLAGIVITAIAGSVLTVTGYDGSVNVTRLLQGNLDVAILSAEAGMITLDPETGDAALVSNGAAALWDTDVIVTRPVASVVPAPAPNPKQRSIINLAAPLPIAPPIDASYYFEEPGVSETRLVRIKQLRKRPGEHRVTIMATDYFSPEVPAPAAGLAFTRPAPVSTVTGATVAAGTPNASQEAVFSIMYDEDEDEVAKSTPSGYSYQEEEPYYTVNGIAIQNNGANYTSKSTFVLSSGYDEIDPNSGAETKDTDEPLTVTLDANGAVLTITGFSGKKWNAVPSVDVTR